MEEAAMPELPDVEMKRREFAGHALGRRIDTVEVITPRILGGMSPGVLQSRLSGRRFRAAQRYGKRLYTGLAGDGWLSFHFGLSGTLRFYRAADAAPAAARVVIGFAGGERLAYVNRRMIGRIEWVTHPALDVRAKQLGPDALDRRLTPARFQRALTERRGAIKAVLMDQTVIAGVGNEYSDEILFQCRLHPATPVAALDARAVLNLYRKLRAVLQCAIECDADPRRFPPAFLIPRRRAGGRCPRCDGVLKTARVGGRNGYFCRRCQPPPGDPTTRAAGPRPRRSRPS
jgi:formamidopyrimidine-DNA glycosylase